MKQGLEVLWWKHNMIPTKGSIQQTPPPLPPSIHLPQASHPPLTYTHTHSHPTPLHLSTFFLFHSILTEPQWAPWGCRLVGKAQKATAKVFTSGSPFRRGFFHWNAKEREILEDPRSLEEQQSPAMHGEYPLLAHTFIQTGVGTPRRLPLSGGPFYF